MGEGRESASREDVAAPKIAHDRSSSRDTYRTIGFTEGEAATKVRVIAMRTIGDAAVGGPLCILEKGSKELVEIGHGDCVSVGISKKGPFLLRTPQLG